MKYYGVCVCGKWGEAPKEFRENKHFLKCECGQLMYLTRHNPIEGDFGRMYGYKDTTKINCSVISQ